MSKKELNQEDFQELVDRVDKFDKDFAELKASVDALPQAVQASIDTFVKNQGAKDKGAAGAGAPPADLVARIAAIEKQLGIGKVAPVLPLHPSRVGTREYAEEVERLRSIQKGEPGYNEARDALAEQGIKG